MTERDSTRKLLIDTAIDLFGRHGYDGVSIRTLATRCGVNVASVKYHFGNKDGLYIQAIDSIATLIQPRLEMVTAIASQAKSLAGDDPLLQAKVMTQLIDAVLTTFLSTPALQQVIPFVLREIVVPGRHFERLYTAIPKRLHEVFADLVGWILGLDPDSERAKIRAHALVGQLIVFQIGRPVLLNRLGLDEYTPAVIDEIRTQVTTSTLLSLGLPNVN